VDDNPANLKLLEGMLRQQGYQVRSFPRGRLALASAAENPPELILLDINMPEMDGFEFLERLRQLPDHAQTPVVILTTEAAQADRTRALGLGVSTYVTKPVRQNDVIAALRAVTAAPHRARPPSESSAIVLHIDYADSRELLDDYANIMATRTILVTNKRRLSADTPVRLALSFPGMTEPISVDGVVMSSMSGDEPTLAIALVDNVKLDRLTEVVEHIRSARR